MTEPSAAPELPAKNPDKPDSHYTAADYRRVAVVICARNEHRTIGQAVEGAKSYAQEVVVMDGHSTDDTALVARDSGATVYSDPGLGKGSAIRKSLRLVSKEVIVFMDADGSHDPTDIPRLALPVLGGETDLCVGSRFAGGSDELSVTPGQLVRTNGNIMLNIAINWRWNQRLTDTLNGFRAIRRHGALAVDLTQDRHTIEQEMVMKMLSHGYGVLNVPAHEWARTHGESHIKVSREWPHFVLCVLLNLLRRDSSGETP